MVNRSLLFSAVVFFTVTALERASAVWRGPPQMLAALDPETRDWVIGLRNNMGGPCCDTADGFPVEVDGWDMAGTVDDTSGMTQGQTNNARSGYRVRLADGKWHDVPNYALIDPGLMENIDPLRKSHPAQRLGAVSPWSLSPCGRPVGYCEGASELGCYQLKHPNASNRIAQ